MKFNKKGKIGILVEVIVIFVIGFVVWHILNFGIQGTAKAVANPLKKLLGIESKEELEKQKEMERVSKELLSTAEGVYDIFKAIMNECFEKNKEDRSCICGGMDFTKLNNFYLKLTNDGDKQILELLSSDKLPVKDKKQGLGGFFIGPIDVRNVPTNFVQSNDYLRPSVVAKRIKESFNSKYILFSKDETIFNKDNTDYKKSSGKMNKINFIKVAKDTIAVDENDNGMRKCGEKLNCVKNYVFFDESRSQIEQKQKELPSFWFEICGNLEPNYCYRFNDQYIPLTSQCKSITILDSTVRCSKNFQPSGQIKPGDLNENMEKQITTAEAYTKFKYIYYYNDVFGKKDNIEKILWELNDKNLDATVILLDTLKPFESANEVSLVTKQLFSRFYSKRNQIVIVIAADGRIEIVAGEEAKNKLKMDTAVCNRFLDKFSSVSDEGIQKVLADIKARAEETPEEYEEDAKRFLNNLLKGYNECLNKGYASETRSGIIGACNCNVKVDLKDLYNYKIEFKLEKQQQEPIWKTTFMLKDQQNILIMTGDIYQLFKPCTRAITGAFSFPPTCPTIEFNSDIIKDYTINGELWLAKGKDEASQGKFEQIFFADRALPLCP